MTPSMSRKTVSIVFEVAMIHFSNLSIHSRKATCKAAFSIPPEGVEQL
jgi:hypothetical protein